MTTPLEALAGVANAAEPIPGILAGGQPTARHLAALKEAGVGIILDIRDPMEPRPFDEAELVAELGMEYVNVPVTAGTMTDDTMARVLDVVRGRGDRTMLFHCASGNRVGGPMIAHLLLDRNVSEDDAIQISMRHGLRGADVLQWGLEYVQRHRR
ncbi:MAG: hypothetical protein AB7L66_17180 [Gemmatimonadales bacterium]